MAQDAGKEMNPKDFLANSRLALEAAEYAKDVGKLEPFHTALFDAYFRDGKNIGQQDVLLELGEAAGLDREGLAKALNDRTYSERVERDSELAKRLNIGAVPSFIFDNKYMVQGAQPYEVFKQVMDQYVLPGRASSTGEQVT